MGLGRGIKGRKGDQGMEAIGGEDVVFSFFSLVGQGHPLNFFRCNVDGIETGTSFTGGNEEENVVGLTQKLSVRSHKLVAVDPSEGVRGGGIGREARDQFGGCARRRGRKIDGKELKVGGVGEKFFFATKENHLGSIRGERRMEGKI